jgi:hypothetical protein
VRASIPSITHVVEGHRLDQGLGVLGLGPEPVGSLPQHLVEQQPEIVVEVL